jgi:ABC-2 type transport system ATP-binding protein
MSEVIISVKDVHKSFDTTKALTGLSLEINRGEIVGLLGPNGAGKSTAIQIMLGLVIADSGSINILGMDIEKDRVKILQRCNFCSAYVWLPYNLKVWENLAVFAELYQVKNYKQKMDELLELFEISHLRNTITGRLSSGESTRVNLCKALISDTEILFLDEPTASLDPDIADKVRKTLMRIQAERKITMLTTSHNMLDIQAICNRILFLQHGNIVASGTAQEIMSRFDQDSLEDVFIHIARGGKERNENKAL